MVELSGHSVRDDANPEGDIEIRITGLRPGEKLYEELTFESEETIATSHRKIFINKLATPEPETVRIALTVLARLVRERNEDELRRFLGDLLPEAHLAPPATQNTRTRRPLALIKSGA